MALPMSFYLVDKNMWFFSRARERELVLFGKKTGVFSFKLFEDSNKRKNWFFLAEKFVKKKSKSNRIFSTFFQIELFREFEIKWMEKTRNPTQK